MYAKLIFICMLLFIPISFASLKTTEYLITIDLNNVMFVVTYHYDNITQRSDYYALFDIDKIEVYADDVKINCNINKRLIGTEVLCNNIYAQKITYVFYTRELVKKQEDYLHFSYNFLVLSSMENLTILIKLPEYAALLDKEILGFTSYQPANAEKGTDGRRIFLKWYFEKPKIGNTIPIQIYYEIRSETGLEYVILFVIAILIIFIYFFKFYAKKEILTVLTPDERMIVEILMKEKKPIEQRKLAKELDMSKSKLSRILTNLEARGIIKRARRGRSNRIKLTWKK